MNYVDSGFACEAVGVCRELTEEELMIVAGGGNVGGAIIGGLKGSVVGGIGGALGAAAIGAPVGAG
jgi:hypothetical protein